MSIFLIENDDVEAERVTRAFSKAERVHTVRRAWDGLEALAILRENPSLVAAHPFIILLDLKMPRMDGLQFLDELRSDPRFKHVIVFVMTTSRNEQDLQHAYQRNIAGYILKTHISAHFKEVIEMLENYCNVVDFPPGTAE